MIKIIQDWFRRYFSDPEVAILALLLMFGFAGVIIFGAMLAPVIASIVIAYLLEGLVAKIVAHLGLPRIITVLIVFTTFMLLLIFLIFGLLPMLSRQVSELVQQLPQMVSEGQKALMLLPEKYPTFISPEQVQELMVGIRNELGVLGQRVVSLSLSSLVGILTLFVYLFLMPLLVFFFLKDKVRILSWVTGYLPQARGLASKVWKDVDVQIGNYVRGKFWEILIVWLATFLTFAFMGQKYAMLLGLMVGLSVLIPYVGATVVTIPVAIIAYFQWGAGPDFIWVMVAYGIVQAFDGMLLVPLLFSEVVNLHPIAIVVAILMFGGLWGFWGVFFAIPLATLVQSVLHAWPRVKDMQEEAVSE